MRFSLHSIINTSILIYLELYNEVFEIIDSCTFSAKSISPTMWMVFELIHKTFKDRAEVYVEGNFSNGRCSGEY